MEVNIRRAKLVVPESKTPNHVLWNSNVDLVIPRIHTSSVYFYKKPLLHDININNDFFNYETLEDALAKALVPFYPMAGRLLPDHPNGRIHIDCNAQGVLLVEAHANVVIDDFGDFTPTHSLKQLIPNVTYTQDISTYPLLLLQVCSFIILLSMNISMNFTHSSFLYMFETLMLDIVELSFSIYLG